MDDVKNNINTFSKFAQAFYKTAKVYIYLCTHIYARNV